MMARNKMVMLCSDPGPWDSHDESMLCRELKEPGVHVHHWMSDDGSVRVKWEDEWKLGSGAWRGDVDY